MCNCISPHHSKVVSCNTRDFPGMSAQPQHFGKGSPGLSIKRRWCGHQAPRWVIAPHTHTLPAALQTAKQQWHGPYKVTKCMEKLFCGNHVTCMASNRDRGEGRGVPKTGSKPSVLKIPPVGAGLYAGRQCLPVSLAQCSIAEGLNLKLSLNK